MAEAFICAAKRSPIGRYAGSLSSIRPDDLLAQTIAQLIETVPTIDPSKIDDVVGGCANQSGEDNRNVARMSALLAGLPVSVPATTINRLCGSGMDAVGVVSRAIKANELGIGIACGVESMSRAPFVVGKSSKGFDRSVQMEDTTMGWRFINPKMRAAYGVDTMPQTGDNVAKQFDVSRDAQDAFALTSQQKASKARDAGLFDHEIISIEIAQRKGDPKIVSEDEHLRPDTTIEQLAALKAVNGPGGTVTAGNASGINDGAAALLLASPDACKQFSLEPMARVVGMAVAGVEPKVMGVGPIDAINKVLRLAGLTLDQIDLIELNEAFASQAIAVMNGLNLDVADPRINPMGGAIALGHPLGMSGARLVTTAAYQLQRQPGARYALCSMCVGVGQGIAMVIERT
jgi:acetyl-CoA acyltransferase